MQKYATILEVYRLLKLGASVRDIRSRTRLGHSTINLIHSRMRSSSLSLSFRIWNLMSRWRVYFIQKAQE